MHGWNDSQWRIRSRRTLAKPGGRGISSSAWFPLSAGGSPCRFYFRVLEGIKEKLQGLSDRFTPGDRAGDEEDDIDVDEVMNNLNDAIVEYQVSGDWRTRA